MRRRKALVGVTLAILSLCFSMDLFRSLLTQNNMHLSRRVCYRVCSSFWVHWSQSGCRAQRYQARLPQELACSCPCPSPRTPSSSISFHVFSNGPPPHPTPPFGSSVNPLFATCAPRNVHCCHSLSSSCLVSLQLGVAAHLQPYMLPCTRLAVSELPTQLAALTSVALLPLVMVVSSSTPNFHQRRAASGYVGSCYDAKWQTHFLS